MEWRKLPKDVLCRLRCEEGVGVRGGGWQEGWGAFQVGGPAGLKSTRKEGALERLLRVSVTGTQWGRLPVASTVSRGMKGGREPEHVGS